MLIQFKRRFSMAHRLRFDRDSKCATPHGHNEFVCVDLQARAGKAFDWGGANYAENFSNLKRQWHRFVDVSLDHAFQLGHDDPMIGYFRAHEPEILPRLLVIQGDPTTEAAAAALYMKLNAIMARNSGRPSNNSSTDVHIQNMNIQTAATDSKGIANSMGDAVRENLASSQTSMGVG